MCANNSPVRAVKIWVFSHALLSSHKKQHSMRTCTTWYTVRKANSINFIFQKAYPNMPTKRS